MAGTANYKIFDLINQSNTKGSVQDELLEMIQSDPSCLDQIDPLSAFHPLTHALFYNSSIEVINALLGQENININKDDSRISQSPLQWYIASEFCNLDIVERLVEDGRANINTSNIRGDTPAHTAILFDHFDVYEYLIGRPDYVSQVDKHGHTPEEVKKLKAAQTLEQQNVIAARIAKFRGKFTNVFNEHSALKTAAFACVILLTGIITIPLLAVIKSLLSHGRANILNPDGGITADSIRLNVDNGKFVTHVPFTLSCELTCSSLVSFFDKQRGELLMPNDDEIKQRLSYKLAKP